MVWFGDRWLAVGWSGTRAATWTSVDGRSWQAGDAVEPAGSSESDARSEYRMSAAIEHAGRLWAVGANRYGVFDGLRAAVWSSDDGATWKFRDMAGTPFDQVAHLPHALVQNGADELVVLSGIGLGSSSTVWISTDGRTWTEHPVDAWSAGESLAEKTAMHGLAAGSGSLMAIGMTSAGRR